MRSRAAASLLLALGCAACGGGESASASGLAVVDSAGVTIVDNGVLDPSLELLASPTPLVQIGLVEGAPELQLFQVADVKRLSDGGVAVANAGTRELRLYDRDGGYRASAGGAGGGPEEFRYPSALAVLPGDTILVHDFMDRVYFTPRGEYVRRVTTDPGAFAPLWERMGGMSEGGQWMADGTFFAPVYRRDRRPRVAGPPYRPAMTLVRVSARLDTVQALGDFGGILQQFVDVGGDRGPLASVPPFATSTSWALGAADGSIAVGDNASPQVRRFPPKGPEMIVRWSAPPEAGSTAEVEAWKDRQRTASWARGRLPLLERAWAAMDVPETKPYYDRVTAGSDGTLWVVTVDAAGGATRLLAFASDGRYRGSADVPGSFAPFDSGPGWLLGVFRDENEVEVVQMFALRSGR